MQNLPIITYKITGKNLLSKGKLIRPPVLADILYEQTEFRSAKFIAGNFYIYQESQGYFVRVTTRDVEVIVLRLLRELNLSKHNSKNYIQETTWFLGSILRTDEPFRYDLIAFNNGTLNLKDMKLVPWSPDLFCTSKINVDFVPNQKPEAFLKFMEQNFEKDEQEFIRALYWSTVTGDNRAQVFIYIYGPGGTGKSTLVNCLTMIAGEGSTLTTTFRDLSKDKFEGLNLAGKRLICINDTDNYQGDLSVVKAISGGDTIGGRKKHQDGALDITPEGILIVTGNQPLQTRDPSGAILRRMRILRMNKVVKIEDQMPLLYRKGGKFLGPLAEECSGILSWSYMDNKVAYKLLKDVSLTKTMLDANKEALQIMNPLKGWLEELDIDPKHKTYLGYTPTKLDINFLVNLVRDRKTLYPAYLIYCAKLSLKPLSHLKFTSELEMVCHAASIPIKKGKDRYGVFIQGLAVNLDKIGNLLGAPSSEAMRESDFKPISGLHKDKTLTKSKLPHMGSETPSTLTPYKINPELRWETRNPELYHQYMAALGETELKKEINKISKTFKPDVDELLQEHAHLLSGLKAIKIPGLDYDFGNPSQEYLNSVRNQIVKGLTKTKTLVTFKYRQMGLSPRIAPQNYGDSINSVKKFIRQKAYSHATENLQDYIILDIDLKSCYTAILLGLFPIEMQRVRQAIEGVGLWNTFEKEFKASGKQALFNKPAVKICVYSSFFLGGPKAMVDGTLDFMRKEIGLTQSQFEDAPYYQALHALARDVATFVNNTGIIEDFRNISKIIKRDFNGQLIKGPTDHEYKIDDHQFMSNYPNFLQSFEFYLIAQATLKALHDVPGSELLGHYHDGNVVIVPEANVYHYISIINNHLETLRQDLGLAYEQVVEFKEFN